MMLKTIHFSGMGADVELIRAFGKISDYSRAMHDMQAALNEESA